LILDVSDLPHLQKLPLAHPVSADKELDIYSLWAQVTIETMLETLFCKGSGPTLVETKVRYFFSGPAPVTTGEFLATTKNVMILTLSPTGTFLGSKSV